MSTRGKREPGYCLAGRATDRVRVGWLPALGSCNEPYKRRHCDMWRITASIAACAIVAACSGCAKPPPDRFETAQFLRAAKVGDLRTMEKLLASRSNRELLRARDRDDHTALDLAVAANDIRQAGVLVDRGADTSEALAFAIGLKDCADANPEMARYLISNGASPSARVGPAGATLLHRAVTSAPAQMVALLIEAGADMNARDDRGETPLHYAARGSEYLSFPVIKLLLAKGADVNARDNSGETPVKLAIRVAQESGDLQAKTARLMISAGARLDDRDRANLAAFDAKRAQEEAQRARWAAEWAQETARAAQHVFSNRIYTFPFEPGGGEHPGDEYEPAPRPPRPGDAETGDVSGGQKPAATRKPRYIRIPRY